MYRRSAWVFRLAALAGGGAAAAHHSFAAIFDANKPVS